MTATPFVQKINQASRDAWPEVTAGVAQAMRSLQELAEISEEVVPKVEEYIARGSTASIRRRKVCEETIWVLAKLGWLRTGGERDVILAAKAWRDLDDQSPLEDCDAAEDDLIAAIHALPEYMTTTSPKES